MTLKRVTHAQAVEIRDAAEAEILEEVNRQLKAFLNELRRLAIRALRAQDNVLLAAGSDEMPTLGEVANMWTTRVDTEIMAAIVAAYERVFRQWSDQGITMASAQMSASRDYIAQVRDRLVRGTHMRTTVYDESFDKIRLTLALANAESWSRGRLATRIAAELSWDKDDAYWRTQLEATDTQIDSILDALGKPGTPTREFARENDPRVSALRADRNNAIKHLDANGSIWRERATLIARTEATGAGNFGALQALTIEGVLTKKWMATEDTRTRETHRAADDQQVAIAQPFVVGASLLQFPGDPTAPVGEVANCRCTIIGGEDEAVVP